MIDLMEPGNTIGVDCHFRNGSPTNEELWPFFKTLKERLRKELMAKNFVREDARLAVSMDMVDRAFNPVIYSATGTVIRDSEAQLRNHCELIGINVRKDDPTQTYFLTLKPGAPLYD